ncbi:hypothetical protein P3H15_44415 [Rhodococcus sp. T2V]|uniref:hypothetical protein n=1 Tax=Rhodococcus sp. T2V TaxID=3034164 RepID=UPI0023E1A9EB|nr:hypothetical protein [Rhodococcus sp. T2V]MDF3312023.1 hypothetical protein [Rhodococcus sp. T2V]
MASESEQPVDAAVIGGRLVALVADRDTATLSHALSAMAFNPHPGSGYPDYEQVLEWAIQAITDVVVARLGPAPPGQEFALAIHRRNGDEIDPAHLPQSRDWVLRTAGMFLADDPEARRERLEAAGRHPDPVQRATLLADALIWLDFLLDADAPDPPDLAA